MGLENREGGQYITILDGKFCKRVTKDTEGAVERVNKIGNTVYEKFYDRFTGKLVDIIIQEGGAYGKNWVFVLSDGIDIYRLQLSYSNSFATALLKMLPNIDLSKEFTMSPSVKVGDDGKKKSSLFVDQNGNHIKHAYTKENPNGLPDMEQIVIKGQMVWDDTKRLDFLEKMVKSDIIPKLDKQGGQCENQADSGFETLVAEIANQDEEDEPF